MADISNTEFGTLKTGTPTKEVEAIKGGFSEFAQEYAGHHGLQVGQIIPEQLFMAASGSSRGRDCVWRNRFSATMDPIKGVQYSHFKVIDNDH